MLQEIFTFVRGSVSNFGRVGAIAPSSTRLAQAITAHVAHKNGPAKVLEVGAGTGVFTKRLVEILGAGDHLDICELHPEFMQYLQKMGKTHPSFQNFKGSLAFLQMPAQQIQGENCYDFIVCGLPFNGFPPELVQELLGVLLRLVKPGGEISYFEYVAVRKLRKNFALGTERHRAQKVDHLMSNFLHQHEIAHVPVWKNFPPAYVRHCQKKAL